MYSKVKMLKVKRLLSTTDTTELTRDGESFMLTKQVNQQAKDTTANSDSTSTDHSTSDQDFQCKELLKPTALTSLSEDGERTPTPRDSSSMEFQRPSRATTGRTDQLTSTPMANTTTCT